MYMKYLLLTFVVLSGMLLSGCGRDADEPNRQPSFSFRLGGDAVTGPQQSR